MIMLQISLQLIHIFPHRIGLVQQQVRPQLEQVFFQRQAQHQRRFLRHYLIENELLNKKEKTAEIFFCSVVYNFLPFLFFFE